MENFCEIFERNWIFSKRICYVFLIRAPTLWQAGTLHWYNGFKYYFEILKFTSICVIIIFKNASGYRTACLWSKTTLNTVWVGKRRFLKFDKWGHLLLCLWHFIFQFSIISNKIELRRNSHAKIATFYLNNFC